jgi:hypothetical protein
MNTLTTLKKKGLLDEEGFFPAIKKENFYLRSSVIAQKYCRDGLPYDIAVSWLQKSIRRCKPLEAQYCAAQIGSMKGVFLSHLINRLIVISSEDIGCACNEAVLLTAETYFRSIKIRKKTGDDSVELRKSIMKLVYFLAICPKSREVDWLIHNNTRESVPVNEEAFREAIISGNIYLAVDLAINCIGEKESIDVGCHVKRKVIFKYWKIMLELCTEERCNEKETVKQLFLLYSKRYDYLQIVHAILVCCGQSHKTNIEESKTNDCDWDRALKSHIKVADVAVDRHTYLGKYVLGRDMPHFIIEGCVLNNHVNIYREEKHWNDLKKINTFVTKKLELYSYQEKAVDKLIRYASDGINHMGLHFPCGMGKTLVSMDFYVKMITCLDSSISCVVIPKLELLIQFLEEWTAYLTHAELDVWIYVNGSIMPNRKFRTKHVYWDKLPKSAELPEHKEDHVIILSTYDSLPKVSNMDFTMIIFDEAHRKTDRHYLNGDVDIILDVTASPKVHLNHVVRYSLDKAIKKGHLSNYEMMFGVSLEEALSRSSKLIIYCKNIEMVNETVELLLDMEMDVSRPILSLTSKHNSIEKRENIEMFRKSRMAVIVNCRILIEGIDVPNCNGSYLTYNSLSDKLLIQTLGRAIRKCPGKDKGMYMFSEPLDNRIIGKIRNFDSLVDTRIIYS